jgi:tetratricopeptide (TPR) repeat protein
MNPVYREKILGDGLVPVSQLSGAFLNPKSPLDLQFAYYESSLVVEYLVQKHGQETLQRVLVDLGAGLPINESLGRYAGSIEALDSEFATFAREKAKTLAPEADWSAPEIPRRADLALINDWVKDHPNNYPGLVRQAQQLIAEKKWEAAKEPLGKMRKLYPQNGGAGSPYRLLAQVHRELRENQAEREVLETLAKLSASDLETFERLGELTAEASQWEQQRHYAKRFLEVNPLVAAPHRRAAVAAEKLKDHALATASYQALLLLDPFDPAEVHFQLATALRQQGDLPQAKRHALLALEEAPRYRAAHQLLLEIVSREPAAPSPSETKPPAAESTDGTPPASETKPAAVPPAAVPQTAPSLDSPPVPSPAPAAEKPQ